MKYATNELRRALRSVAAVERGDGLVRAHVRTMSIHLSRDVLLDVLKRAERGIGRGPTETIEPSVALARACDELGVDPDAFDTAIAGDLELELLKTNVLRQAIAGTTDPGPYAEISRESPAGQPGDIRKNRSEPEPPVRRS